MWILKQKGRKKEKGGDIRERRYVYVCMKWDREKGNILSYFYESYVMNYDAIKWHYQHEIFSLLFPSSIV